MDPLNYDARKYLTELLYGRGSCGKTLCAPCGTMVPCDLPWREIMENVRLRFVDKFDFMYLFMRDYKL